MQISGEFMTKHQIREAIGNLKNKPLVEAIFELGWSIEGASPLDQMWDVLPGLYFGSVREEYPHIENLPASQVPAQLTTNVVRHRFRRGKDQWPLTQLGPGILTVNDSAGYSVWEDFLPRITQSFDALTNSISKVSSQALQFSRVELRYINAVPFDESRESIMEFLTRKLHIHIGLPALYDGEGDTEDIDNANITFHVPLKKPPGTAEIMAALGKKGDEESVIFHLIVRSKKTAVPQSREELEIWANDAHNVIDAWFMKLCEGELLNSFKG